MRLQLSIHVGTKGRCVPDRVVGVASVVETETTIESGAEVVVARGPDKGLRHVDLGHRTRANSERGGEKRWGGRARPEGRVVCRIEVRAHAAELRNARSLH